MRLILLVLGWVFVGVGIIGIFVPVLPTFDFMLLAAACFAKSSPRVENWLVNESRFGPALRAWRRDRSMSRANKVSAVCAIALCFGLTITFAPILVWLKAGLALVAISLIAYIATRPYSESGSEGSALGT